MSLNTFKISNFRNLIAAELIFDSGFNVISGHNGSGKTSLLEAIYFLTHGRSFKTNSINRIINNEAPSFTLFANFFNETKTTTQAGVTRNRNGEIKIRINGEDNKGVIDLISLQPLLLLNPFTFQLLDAGPIYRRQFIDWGLFHVEHHFILGWRRVQRALKQRNSALKNKEQAHQAKVWDSEFVTASNTLNKQRKGYLEQLKPIFLKIIADLTPYQDITIQYNSGWDEDAGLQEVLNRSFERDCLLGYTQYGPQKADIIIKCNTIPAAEVCSRGEQKLLVYALKLAQGMYLQQVANKDSIYLIDDLSAELDENNQERLFHTLAQLKTQVITTSVVGQPRFLQGHKAKLFNIQKGIIEEV